MSMQTHENLLNQAQSEQEQAASTSDPSWFTERCQESGSAFSLALTKEACVHREQTPFQCIEVYATSHFGNVMVIDGFIMLSSYDNFFYHEMISHPVLFSHPTPKQVVIIGGGDCGTLQQVLRHQCVTSVLQIDIDERVTRLSETFFPELCVDNGDLRAEFRFVDGINWMREASSASVDVVIVDSTDPIGSAAGLFNDAFYRQCHRVLRADGLLVQQSESPLIHLPLIRNIHQAMQRSGFQQLQLLPFPQPVYPSGWWSVTMAAKMPGLKTFRTEAAANKTFSTRYYDAAIHQGALATPHFVADFLQKEG